MWFDVISYAGWLAAALTMGLVVGWRTYSDAPRRWFGGWIIWGALVFVVGVIVAVLKLLPGRYGLWLEIALLMTASYIIGCFLGGSLKTLLGAHEPRSAARAAADRLAVEVAAKAQAGRKAATAAKAQTAGLAAALSAKADTEQKAAALPRADANRQARSPRRGGQRLLPLPRWRRIAPQRKLLQKRSLEEKLLRPPKPRRIIRLQKLPRRPRLSDRLPPRPRRIIWLQRLPRRSKSNERLILIASPAKARSGASSTRHRVRRTMDERTISS
jgi:hypothetical protein